MEQTFIRAFCQRGEKPGEAGSPIRFVASTEGVKRDGLDLRMEDWRLDNFRANPVFLWCHDMMGQNLPIGRVALVVEVDRLLADVIFDQADEFAKRVESKYRRGYLNAVSIGWNELRESEHWVRDLLEISGVPVPADPQALKADQARALRALGQDLLDAAGEQPQGAADKADPASAQADSAIDQGLRLLDIAMKITEVQLR